MRVMRPIILPGTECVEVQDHGSFNFVNGEADFPREIAQELIKRGVCKAIDPDLAEIPMGTKATADMPAGKKRRVGGAQKTVTSDPAAAAGDDAAK